MSIRHGTVWHSRCPEGDVVIRWEDDRFVHYVDGRPVCSYTGPQLNDMGMSLSIWARMATSKTKKGRR